MAGNLLLPAAAYAALLTTWEVRVRGKEWTAKAAAPGTRRTAAQKVWARRYDTH